MLRFITVIATLALFATVGCGTMDMGDGSSDKPSTMPIPAITYDAVFVVNGGDNSMSVIDTSNNKVAATISMQNVSFPHHVNLSPDGMSLVVAIPGSDLSGGHGGGHSGMSMTGAILKVDARTGETRASRRLDGPNHNGIFSPDGKEIWTSQMTMTGQVLVLDASTLATKQAIAVGDMPAEVTFSTDGKYAFVANGMSNSVTVIDRAEKKVVKTIAVGTNPVGAWSGRDGVMYVDNEDSITLTAVNATSLDVVRTYNLGFTPGMAATAPSGDLWVTDSTAGRVVFYSTTTGAVLGALSTGAGAHGVLFSADGTRAYVSNQAGASVTIIDVGARSVVTTVRVGDKPNGMAFRSR